MSRPNQSSSQLHESCRARGRSTGEECCVASISDPPKTLGTSATHPLKVSIKVPSPSSLRDLRNVCLIKAQESLWIHISSDEKGGHYLSKSWRKKCDISKVKKLK